MEQTGLSSTDILYGRLEAPPAAAPPPEKIEIGRVQAAILLYGRDDPDSDLPDHSFTWYCLKNSFERQGIAASSASNALRSLTKRGLLSKNEKDWYSFWTITEAGQAALQSLEYWYG